MALETGSFIDDLVITNPLGADAKNEGDDHIRLVKKVVKATFPGLGGAAWRVQTKTGTYTVVAGDNMTTINCTTALTLNLTAAATLGNQHMFLVVANGGAVTVDPDGAETVNGSATVVIADGSSVFVICSGTLFLATVAAEIVTPLPRSYGAGCILSNDTDATNDINVTAGAWRNATDDGNLVLSSEQTKRIDASWATGDDAGGLSSSLTLTNATWYHVFLILVSGVVEVGFDTSVVAANLIADHSATKYRRIGSVRRGTATNIAFIQIGDKFLFDVNISEIASVDPGTSAVLVPLTMPLGIVVEAILAIVINDDSASNAADVHLLVTSPDQTDTVPSVTRFTVVSQHGDGVEESDAVYGEFTTDTSSQIRYRISRSAADVTIRIQNHGWVDRRGRDD